MTLITIEDLLLYLGFWCIMFVFFDFCWILFWMTKNGRRFSDLTTRRAFVRQYILVIWIEDFGRIGPVRCPDFVANVAVHFLLHGRTQQRAEEVLYVAFGWRDWRDSWWMRGINRGRMADGQRGWLCRGSGGRWLGCGGRLGCMR